MRRILAGLLAVAILLGGCSGDQASPEDRIRESVAAFEQAVEAGSVSDAGEFVHPAYRDDLHPDRRAALRSLAGYLFRHRDRHLLTVVRDITLNAPADAADVTVLVGMSGTPVDNVDRLLLVKADLYRFDLQMRRVDDLWLISGSRWERVSDTVFR